MRLSPQLEEMEVRSGIAGTLLAHCKTVCLIGAWKFGLQLQSVCYGGGSLFHGIRMDKSQVVNIASSTVLCVLDFTGTWNKS